MPKIGLSRPYAANYSNDGSRVSYTDAAPIGRFVSLNITLEDNSDNDFYSDNAVSETDNQFPGGTAEVTTDDLSPEAMVKTMGMVREPISGVEGVESADAAWIVNNDNQTSPFLGFGGIAKKKHNGAISYVAIVLDKVRFRNVNDSITTQGESISWQTPSLTADIYRSDKPTHDWRRYSTPFETEEEAEAALKGYFSENTEQDGDDA